jgi:hypothetical protein
MFKNVLIGYILSRKSNKKNARGIRAIQNHALTLLNQKENQLILNIFPVTKMSKVILNQNYKT